MKSVVVGTAGHIDHGKSALVRALTGTDPDRLQEEKRRGITIDIGFAHLELAGAGGERLRIGFVDVPGHERFVRNMLAGVGGIDMVLLVIAADEGVKPQTREHFDICRLLNIPRGITVLTKSDLVDRETLDVVRLEVEEFSRGSFLDGAPVVAVSAKTGDGLQQLKHEMARVAAEVRARDSQSAARLPIDRVFSMKGFGTVITGTLVSGSIAKEQELQLFPAGGRVRVRGVQVHGAAAERAVAGQRTALNLAGVGAGDLARGMTLTASGVFRTAQRVDASLSLLPDAKPLRDRSHVHLHAYTTETIAEVVLLGTKQMKPGEQAYAQLRLRQPWLFLPGDRFIIRQFSPVVTIGGGVILDIAPPRRLAEAAQGERAAWLAKLEKATPAEALRMRVLHHGEEGLSIVNAIAATGLLRGQIAALLPPPDVRCVGDVLIAETEARKLSAGIVAAVENFHNRNPLAPGMSREGLRAVFLRSPAEVFENALNELVRQTKLEVSGETVKLAGRGVAMKDEEAESKRVIERAFSSAGLKVPALKDVLAGLKVDRVRAQKIVTLLLRDKVLVKLSDELVFHRDALDQLRKLVAGQKAAAPRMDVGKFKDLTGVSRKYAIPLLEYLDRERVTRRVGDVREIL